MARRHKEPVEKCAFPGGIATNILMAISGMEAKQARLAREPFQPEDLLRLFVNPDDRAVLCRAWDLVEPAGTVQELFAQVDKPAYALTDNSVHPFVYMRFQWTRSTLQKGFYVPHRDGSAQDRPVRLRLDAPKELVERFMETAMTLTDIHWRFSLVRRVFNRLNKESVCRTPPAMRYVWPCIHTLCGRAGLTEAAEATREPNEKAGGKVMVPLTIINLLKETNDTVLRAQFLADVDAPVDDLPIKYELLHGFPTN